MSDLINRKAAIEAINRLINRFEQILRDIRETNVDDSVCGMCEYDEAYVGQSGDWCNECPGFEKEDCFKLSDECRKRWMSDTGLPSASPNSSESPNGWIPCKKKLPEKSEKYEVTIKNVTTIFDGETGEMVERVGYYVDCDIYKSYLLRKWHRYDGGQVIAWRKLPEPYQPKEDES